MLVSSYLACYLLAEYNAGQEAYSILLLIPMPTVYTHKDIKQIKHAVRTFV